MVQKDCHSRRSGIAFHRYAADGGRGHTRQPHRGRCTGRGQPVCAALYVCVGNGCSGRHRLPGGGQHGIGQPRLPQGAHGFADGIRGVAVGIIINRNHHFHRGGAFGAAAGGGRETDALHRGLRERLLPVLPLPLAGVFVRLSAEGDGTALFCYVRAGGHPCRPHLPGLSCSSDAWDGVWKAAA